MVLWKLWSKKVYNSRPHDDTVTHLHQSVISQTNWTLQHPLDWCHGMTFAFDSIITKVEDIYEIWIWKYNFIAKLFIKHRYKSVPISLFVILGLCEVGGVVVSLPRMVETRTILWILWTTANAQTSQEEDSHITKVELNGFRSYLTFFYSLFYFLSL